jgi:hypothetical protein
MKQRYGFYTFNPQQKHQPAVLWRPVYSVLLVLLFLTSIRAFAQTPTSTSCSNATGVCTGSTYSFPASTNSGSALVGANYGCLKTQPNPAWFFMQMDNPGSITITMTSSPARDIDFIIWGPFTDPFAQCVAGLDTTKIVDCSYSTASAETGTIPSGLTGEYYVLLITNYSNNSNNITFSQTGGTGTSNCDILCNITSLTATPGACATGAGAGTYAVTGTVTSFTPPATGTLTVSSSCGSSVTFNAPFSTSIPYTLPNVTGNGGSCIITASYSAVPTCIRTRTITASTCCTVSAGNQSECEGETVTLTATGTAGGSYFWTGPNGFTSTLQNPSIPNATMAHAGIYSVYLVNGTCTTSVENITVTIKPIPDATVTANGPTTFCDYEDVTFSVTSGSGLTYRWKRNGSNISGATSSTYTATTTGSYSVVVSNTGCGFSSATSTSIPVTVNASPTATTTASGATTFCAGDSVTLTANAGTGLTYQWTLNGTNIVGATNQTYVAKTSGSYRVVTTNASLCSQTSSSRTVTVNTLPTATVTPADSAKFCQGGQVTLSANTGTGLTYQWFTGATSVGTGPNVNVAIVGAFKVVVTNSSGCKATSSITTVSKYTVPSATVSGSPLTFCTGDSVKLNANTAIGFTYQWKKNTVNISGATSSSYTATTSGTYTVTVAQSFCSGLTPVTSSGTTVIVNTLPAATISAGSSTTFCNGDSVTLSANTGTGLSYKWLKNGSLISGATASTYKAKTAGSYRVLVTNSSSCSDTSAVTTVTVNSLPTASISAGGPTTFCSGNSVVLTGNTGTGFTYQCKKNGSVIGSALSNAYTADSSGTYLMIVSDANSCKATSSGITITVNTYPPATITPVGSTTFCVGNNVTLNANTGTGLSYEWKLDGNTIAGAASNSLSTVSTAGNYIVIVTRNSCATTSSATSVIVNPRPAPGQLIIHE